jgi:hypothetical protein
MTMKREHNGGKKRDNGMRSADQTAMEAWVVARKEQM